LGCWFSVALFRFFRPGQPRLFSSPRAYLHQVLSTTRGFLFLPFHVIRGLKWGKTPFPPISIRITSLKTVFMLIVEPFFCYRFPPPFQNRNHETKKPALRLFPPPFFTRNFFCVSNSGYPFPDLIVNSPFHLSLVLFPLIFFFFVVVVREIAFSSS